MMIVKVGVIILVMEIYRVICLLEIKSPLCTRTQVPTHIL